MPSCYEVGFELARLLSCAAIYDKVSHSARENQKLQKLASNAGMYMKTKDRLQAASGKPGMLQKTR
jgi:hypothetical protein